MSASATSSCRFSSANSLVRLATGRFATYIGRAYIIPGIMILGALSFFDNTPSLRGYYLHMAHFICGTARGYIILRTSKPVSKLLTASCNPLSTDEILSITVPMNARCSSEIDAHPSRFFSSSDRAPDGAGLVPWPLSKAGRREPWGAI